MKIKLLLLTILLGSQGFLFGMGGPGATRVNIAGTTPVIQTQVPTLFEQSLQALEKRLEQKILRAEYIDLVKEIEKLPGDLIYPLILRMALRNKNLSVADKLNLLGVLVFYSKEAHLKNFKRVFNKLRSVLARGIFPMNYKGDLTKKDFTKTFIVHGYKISPRINLLHDAVIRGDKELIKLLLAAGFDINAKGGKAFSQDLHSGEFEMATQATPLIWAIILNNEEMVNLLIDYGADVNLSSYKVFSPLQLALKFGSKKAIINLLIQAGADVNKKGVLLEASGYPELFKLLLDKGASPDTLVDHPRYNILGLMVEQNEVELVRLLLEKGAKVNTELDRDGYRALDYTFGREEMINLLKKYGAKKRSE